MAHGRDTDEVPTWADYRAALRQSEPKRPSPLVEWFREYGLRLVLILVGGAVLTFVVWYFATAKLIIVNRSSNKFCSISVFEADSGAVTDTDLYDDLEHLANIKPPIKTQSTNSRIIVVSLQPGIYTAGAICGLYYTDPIQFELERGQTKTVIIDKE